MIKILSLIKKIFLDQKLAKLKSFIIVGLVAVLFDYLTYVSFNTIIHNISISKAFGFIFGTSFSFLGNKTYTFKTNFSIVKFMKYLMLYFLTLNLNILSNNYFLANLNTIKFSGQISFIMATGICAVINFIGLNYFVFHKKFISRKYN